MEKDSALLQVTDLSVHYATSGRGVVRAVDGIGFALRPGETLALVGESGCGKSTVGRALIGLQPAAGGSMLFDGDELVGLPVSNWKSVRRRMSLVFQDPFASLDPRWRVGASVTEPLSVHGLAGRRELKARARELMKQVGLDEAMADRFPHELSGGQRQRVALARALATHPKLVIADEPTAALDISIRAQILNLIKDLQAEHGMAYLFISHDLATVQYLAHRVAVMYLGRIVEIAPTAELFARPAHPYTRALLASIPPPEATGKLPPALPGDLPDPFHLPSGCRFRTRCPMAQEICAVEEPPLAQVGPDHWAACHFPVIEPQ